MADRVPLPAFLNRRLPKAAEMRSRAVPRPATAGATGWASALVGRLISSSDTAKGNLLREHTRMALSTLTPHEQHALRRRFGIADTPRDLVAAADSVGTVSNESLLEFETQALRKLRRTGRRPLRSVSRS